MADFHELHQILFQVKTKTATESYQMLKTAFGEQVTSHSKTPEWVSQFKADRTSADDDQCPGQLVSSSTPEMAKRMRHIIREDCHRTTDEVSAPPGIGHGSCHRIKKEDLKMWCPLHHKVCAQTGIQMFC